MYGSAAVGLKTRTSSPSAQETLPATGFPFAVTVNALAVAARSIGAVKRTESVASRATSSVSARGRKRTTDAAATVRTSSDAVGIATPSASCSPLTTSRYFVSAWRPSVGVNRKLVVPAAAPSTVVTVPATGVAVVPPPTGRSWIAAVAASVETDPLTSTSKAVEALTREASRSVAAIVSVAAPRVRKAVWTGLRSGWPLRASAPAATVTVWYVAGRQPTVGAIVRVVSAGSQLRRTSVAGETVVSASTDAGSIGALKVIVIVWPRPAPVVTTGPNAASVSGTGWLGGVAATGAGCAARTTPSARMPPSPSATPPRTSADRRRTDDR